MFRPILGLVVVVSFFVSGTSPATAAHRVALVIGNDAYDNVTHLKKADNDARAVGATLARIGFDVTTATDVTRREMNRKLLEFTSKLEAGDEAFFFFAGHGVEIEGRNYLLPTDIPEARPGQETFVQSEAIAADTVLTDIRSRGARITVMVLDACRDNPFQKEGTRSVGTTRGLARMPAPEGTFIMYSAGVGQTALDRLGEGDDNPNSVFTRRLLPLLAKPGMTLPQTARQLRRDVQSLASTVSHEQRPAYYDEITGEFFMAGAKPGAAVSGPDANTDAASAAEATDPGAENTSLELAFWNAVKDSADPAAVREYLARFPSGTFAGLAEQKLRSLETRQAALEPDAAPAQEAPARATQSGLPMTDCDRMAAEPDDPDRVGLGVLINQLPASKAIAACRAALRDHPGTPRFIFQLGRAYQAKGDFALARSTYREAADAGSVYGKIYLALLALNGKGGDKDATLAAQLLKETAEGGSAEAMSNLGLLYERGWGVPQSMTEAAKLYRKAAEMGFAEAMHNIAVMYEKAEGVAKDDAEAVRWYKKAADRGVYASMFNLAIKYYKGEGVKQNAKLAASLAVRAIKGDGSIVTQITAYAELLNAEITRELQTALKSEGVYRGRIDGQYGPGTERALKALATR